MLRKQIGSAIRKALLIRAQIQRRDSAGLVVLGLFEHSAAVGLIVPNCS